MSTASVNFKKNKRRLSLSSINFNTDAMTHENHKARKNIASSWRGSLLVLTSLVSEREASVVNREIWVGGFAVIKVTATKGHLLARPRHGSSCWPWWTLLPQQQRQEQRWKEDEERQP